MRFVEPFREASLAVAVALLLCSNAIAAPVTWTIDSTATSLHVSGTGQAPISGSTVQLRIIAQGSSPSPGGTPTAPAKISGYLVTDTDFTNSIKFIKAGSLEGETTGNWKPDHAGNNLALPGDIGGTIQAKVGSFYTDSGDVTLRNLQYDLSGSSSVPIVAGSFPSNGLTLSVLEGDFDYRGYNLGAVLGSGTIDLGNRLLGDANLNNLVDGADYIPWADNFLVPGPKLVTRGDFNLNGKIDGADYTIWSDNFLKTAPNPELFAPNLAGNGTISKVDGHYQLTLPIDSVLRFQLYEGVDDLFFDLKLSGTLIATAPDTSAALSVVPEPGTGILAMCGAALLGCVAWVRSARGRR